MDEYERVVWGEISDWRARKPRAKLRRLVPQPVRDIASDAAARGRGAAQRLPFADQFQAAMKSALEGMINLVMEAGAASVAESPAIRRLRRSGHRIERIDDIRQLPLEVCDKAFPRNKRFVYAGLTGAQGAAAGVATTVGDLEAFVGGTIAPGVGAAPGAGQVIAVIAADMAGLLIAATRLVAETGMAYGYDPDEPSEKIFIAAVLGVATAGTESAKLAAYRELSELTQKLARRATWQTLNESQLANVLTRLYNALGFRLYQKNLRDAIPFAGIAFGAGTNVGLMLRVADEAYYSYRERRIRDSGGGDGGFILARDAGPHPDEDGIGILEVLGEELREGA